jgi:hypothetical protein
VNLGHRTGALALAAAALLASGAAVAAAKVSEAQRQYNEDRAHCMSGQSNQDRATCLKEAGAAFQEAKRGGLSTGTDADVSGNKTIRCETLPARDRKDCVMRMQGEGVARGNSQDGGIIRELARPVPTR